MDDLPLVDVVQIQEDGLEIPTIIVKQTMLENSEAISTIITRKVPNQLLPMLLFVKFVGGHITLQRSVGIAMISWKKKKINRHIQLVRIWRIILSLQIQEPMPHD